MDKLLEPCITLAQSAGDAIMAIYKKDDIGQQEKSDNTKHIIASHLYSLLCEPMIMLHVYFLNGYIQY